VITASAAFQQAIEEGSSLSPSTRVIAEWNHNRYTEVTTVDNFGYAETTYGYELDMFPIETIINPIRPTAGLLKGRAGEGATVQGYSDTPVGYRTYTADPDSKYKYWTGPSQSDDTTYVGGGFTLNDPVKPYIIYASNVYTNKLYICVENSWAGPEDWDIQITTDGTTWTTVASNITPGSNGVVTLYRQSGGTWSTTQNFNYPTNIRGIRLLVNSMDTEFSWFNLIELGARLEVDLSSRLIDYSITNELSDPDFISPLGTISSNTGSISLSNIDGLFNSDSVSSPYKGLIDANTKFTIDFGVDVSDWGGSGYEYVRQATMFAESWGGSEDTVEVSLKDASKFLQEIKPLPELMQDVTIGMAIWRILDSIGFIDYNYTRTAEVASTQIPFYWTDDEQTVWDNIQEICRTTQSAAYFDEYGILQIRSRDSAFDTSQSPSWVFDYHVNGSKQPDIVDLTVGNTFEANKVTVKYQTTNLATDTQGRPISEIVWQPEDDIVLRCSGLANDMTISDDKFWIDKNDAALWPYDGMVNICGELIKYSGKGYRYYPVGGSYTGDLAADTEFKVIYSSDEQLQVDNELSSDTQGWRNYFTGYLKVTERGYDDTTAKAHDVNIDAWLANGSYYGIAGGTQKLWNGGTKLIAAESLMRLQTTGKKATTGYWYTARRGGVSDEPPKMFGTRMRFPTSPAGKNFIAGIWVWGNAASNQMYGIDITATAAVDRKVSNEVRVLKRSGGVVTTVGGKGAVATINKGQWFDVDVVVTSSSRITVSINGSLVLDVIDSSPITATGRGGLYVRGDCVADFEYFYMLADGGIQETDLDNQSYLDLINGGYYSNQYYKNFVSKERIALRRRGRKTVTYTQRYDQRYFDEFGMLVHEYRPYVIDFDKKPVLYSSLYVSNDDQIVQDEYVHNPFGAHFIIANASRFNSVVNGEDTVTYGVDNTVTQKLMITGRTVQQAEAVDYVVSNEQAIRARGEIALELSSQWIQSKAAAVALGDWIVDNWSTPADDVELTIFGNPLIQIGDVIAINYPPRDMAESTHKYFVLGVSQSWDNGLQTTLTLRRANI
jgi:hypothetical protein